MSEQTAIEAMREALASALRNFDAMGQAALAGEINTDAVAMVCASMSAKISAALGAQMRNCDRYPTEAEASAAFYHYCIECKAGDYLAVARCSCRETCAWRWLFT